MFLIAARRPAVTDLIGGQIQVAFTELATSLGHVKEGQAARARGDDRATRRGAAGRADACRIHSGFRGEPVGRARRAEGIRRAPIIEKLNAAINAGLADARMKARFADIGGMVLPGSPADFGKLIRDETEKWAQGDPRRPYQADLIARIVHPDLPNGVERAAAHWRRHPRLRGTGHSSHRDGGRSKLRPNGWLAKCAGSASNRRWRNSRSARVDAVAASLAVEGRTIEGLPLFDGGFTGPGGIAGALGHLASDAPIGFAELLPNAAEAGALGEARRHNRSSGHRGRDTRRACGAVPEQCRQLRAPVRAAGVAAGERASAVPRRMRAARRGRGTDSTCRTHAGAGVQRRRHGLRGRTPARPRWS